MSAKCSTYRSSAGRCSGALAAGSARASAHGAPGVLPVVEREEVEADEEGVRVPLREPPDVRPVRVPPHQDVAEVEHDGVDHPSSAGSICARTVPPSRRALRTASDADNAAPVPRRGCAARGRRHGRRLERTPLAAATDRDRTEDLGVREVEPGQQRVDGVAGARDSSHPHGGRQGQLRALGELARCVPRGVPAHERLGDPLLGVADEHDGPARGRRAHQRGGREPAAQGVLPASAATALPCTRPRRAAALRRTRPARPARRPASRRRARARGDRRQPPPAARAPETRTGTPVNARPSSSAVRSEPTRTERSAPAPHSGTASRRRAARTSRTAGRRRPWQHRAGRGIAAARRRAARARTRRRAGSRRAAPARGRDRRRARSRNARHAVAGRRPAAAGPSARELDGRQRPTRGARARDVARSAAPRAPSRTPAATAPRRCGRAPATSRRRLAARRAAPAPRARAGTARAARRAGRRRRPSTTTSPRSATGANAAARVPTTTRTRPRSAREEGAVAGRGAVVGGQPHGAPWRPAPARSGVERRVTRSTSRRVGHHEQRTPAAGRDGGREPAARCGVGAAARPRSPGRASRRPGGPAGRDGGRKAAPPR